MPDRDKTSPLDGINKEPPGKQKIAQSLKFSRSAAERISKTVVVGLLALILLIPALLIWIPFLFFRGVGWIRENHSKASEVAGDVAKATVLVSKVAMFWAWLVAPSGLIAVAAGIGVTSTPLIVILAPILIAVSGATIVISHALALYSKWKSKANEP